MSIKPKDLNDVELQLPLPVEEHDTITSLNNKAYLKKIKRIKSASKSSLNSAFISGGSAPNTPTQSDLMRSASTESTKSGLRIPEGLMSLFRARNDNSISDDSVTGLLIENQPLNNEQLVAILTGSNNKLQNSPTDNIKVDSTQFLNQLKSTQLLAQTDTSTTVNNSESQKGHGKNKTDQVYEALSLLISDSNINLMQENDFVNALRVIVKQTEDSQQRQKNNMASLCTLVTFTVFFLMMFMIGLFAYRLHSITNNLMEHLSDSQMEFKVNASIARNSTKF